VLAPGIGALDPGGIALAALAAVTICGMILCSARAQAFATSTQVNFWLTTVTGGVLVPLTAALDAWRGRRMGSVGSALRGPASALASGC